MSTHALSGQPNSTDPLKLVDASDLFSVAGQRVLITGGAGGIGAGISRLFAAAGARVAIQYRASAAAAEALSRELCQAHGDGAAVAIASNLDDADAAPTLISRTVEALGGLDGVVNNAGVQPVQMLAEMTRTEWDAMFATNLSAVFAVSAAAAAALQPSGWITHIASIEATRPALGHAHYAAAKAGVVMHAKAAALEYGPRGVRINTVSPGLTDTGTLRSDWPEGVASWRATVPLGRLGVPDDVARACVFLASSGASFITGHDLVVDGGMLATPGW